MISTLIDGYLRVVASLPRSVQGQAVRPVLRVARASDQPFACLADIDGVRFALDLSMPNHRSVLRARAFEPELTSALERVLEPGDVFVDVGSNFGWYAVRVATRYPVEHVYAFEPSARLSRLLRGSIAANHCEGTCAVHSVALSSAGGQSSLRTFKGLDPMHSSLHQLGDAAYEEEPVTLDTLDRVSMDFVAQPSVVKCDVEGGEKDVLLGSAAVLGGGRANPPIWFLEANYETAAMAGFFPSDLIDIAQAAAPYSPYYIRGGKVVPLPSRHSLRHGDALILAIKSLHRRRLDRAAPSVGNVGVGTR